jgi:hypothetical protein
MISALGFPPSPPTEKFAATYMAVIFLASRDG